MRRCASSTTSLLRVLANFGAVNKRFFSGVGCTPPVSDPRLNGTLAHKTFVDSSGTELTGEGYARFDHAGRLEGGSRTQTCAADALSDV